MSNMKVYAGSEKRRQQHAGGFTLAELLIVVAIIAVLVVIAIPIFSTHLEKSREATDLANVRSAYALVKTSAMTGEPENENVKVSGNDYSVVVSLEQKKNGWDTDRSALNVGGITPQDTARWLNEPKVGGSCEVSCDINGETFINWNGYLIKATVAENRAKYANTLNAVLSTLKKEVVNERLKSQGLHVAYVLITGGKVTGVSYYRSEGDNKSVITNPNSDQKLSSAQLSAINSKITDALQDEAYTVAGNETARIYFDWSGNVVSGLDENGKAIGIAGQSAGASIKLSNGGGNTDAASLRLDKDNVWN